VNRHKTAIAIAQCKQLFHTALVFLKEVAISESIHTCSRPARLAGNTLRPQMTVRVQGQPASKAANESLESTHLDLLAD
jgi:hypothetical protein